MTITNQVPAYDDVVRTRQIDRRFTLIVLAVEELVVFDRDVMRLVKLDQVQPVVVLHRIVSSGASGGRTLVMNFAVPNDDMAGPKTPVVPSRCVTTRRIVCLYVI